MRYLPLIKRKRNERHDLFISNYIDSSVINKII